MASQFCLTPIYETKLVRYGSIKTRPELSSSDRAKDACVQYLGDSPNERFVVVILDTKLRVIGMSVVTVGTLDASLVHPREAFRPAILLNGSAVLFCHNHPSSDLTPSRDDRLVSDRLTKAGDLLGIRVLDFLICNDTEAVSMSTMP